MKIKCPNCKYVVDLGGESASEIFLAVKCPNCKTKYTFKSELSISELPERENIIICKRCGLKNEAKNEECFDCGQTLIGTKTNNQIGKSGQKVIFENVSAEKNEPKKSLSSVILWILGLLFGMAGLGALTVNTIVTFIYFLIALLIIPFTHSKIESLVNFKISKTVRVITVLVLIFLAAPFFPTKEVKKNDPNATLSEFIKSAKDKPNTTSRTITTSKSDCWELGYKFGYCATLALHGYECRPEDDVVIPVECRGNNKETNMGIRSGTEKAFDKLGLPKK